MAKKKTQNELRIRNSTAEFLTFAYQTGGDGVEVRVQDGMVWLSQRNVAILFDTTIENVKIHMKNIFTDGELDKSSTSKEYLLVQKEGERLIERAIKHYNLDVIIAVGYRVNSERATAFRQWATGVLRDYTLRGYILDRKRMENGAFLDDDYFERLLEEIREIRLSERRFYQKITDLYATAMDYDKDSPITREFFAKVQNKMHFAVHGHTASELIFSRADASKEHMGLTNWANSPNGKIVKSDARIAKNYLTEAELDDLQRIVNAYLELAENRAKKKIPMTMATWAERLDIFLTADDREILQDAGKITMKIARDHADKEYEKYRKIQDKLFQSDFDRFLELTLQTDVESEDNLPK